VSALWTKGREAQLRRLHARGLSPRQIVAELRVSRNAVIGKSGRMGLKIAAPQKKKPTAVRKPGPKFAHLASVRAAVMAQPPVLPTMPDGAGIPTVQRCTLLQLRNGVCKWPFGEPTSPDFFFCGDDAVEGKPYCPEHCRVAYRAWAA
jgi:GcrA cell cycle regulator